MRDIGKLFDKMADEPQGCKIRVDKDGVLWYGDAEMTHHGINQLLLEHVERDASGRYVILLNGESCQIEPEDTVFVILSVQGSACGHDGYCLTLNDHTTEWLDPESLWQSPDYVLYATVKGGRFPARFARPAYYQLAGFMVERDGAYFLPEKGREHRIHQIEAEVR